MSNAQQVCTITWMQILVNNTILKRKPIIKDKNGDEFVDLTKKSMNFTNEEPYIISGQYVSEEHQMRPDLISYVNFGDDSYWDLILKFNGVSNPFSLSQEQFLFIPDIQYMLRQLYVETSNNEKIMNEVKAQYVDASKKAKPDPKQFEYNKYTRDFFKSNPNLSKKDCIICWNYKKKQFGKHKYEKEDLNIL